MMMIYCTRIPAHKVVLASCSEYFAAMFTGALRESQLTEIAIERVDAQALQSLVHYCYTGTIGKFIFILLLYSILKVKQLNTSVLIRVSIRH